MNTIEQRVRIPAGPQAIWQYISNLENNAQWQVSCNQVTFITTNRDGRGARWRYNTDNGRNQVAEVTAWYNEVGYEYVIVDGTSFKQNIGRIKLHETAEGTVVHWTFEYELGGVFSSLRSSLTRRTIEDDMAESLWRLWEIISKTDPAQLREFQARSLMRDAPDVEERANYKSRRSLYHPQTDIASTNPTVSTPNPPSQPTYEPPAYQQPEPEPTKPAQPVSFQRPTIIEPPITDDDTRPNPAIQPTEQPPTAPSTNDEPDFLSRVESQSSSEPTSTSFTFSDPESIPVDDFTFEAEQPKSRDTQETSGVKLGKEHTSEKDLANETTSPTIEADDTQQIEDEQTIAGTNIPIGQRTTETLPKLPRSEDEDDKVDTSNVSIFDLFGVPKPSDSQRIDAVEVVETEAVPSEATLPDTDTAGIEKSAVTEKQSAPTTDDPDKPNSITEANAEPTPTTTELFTMPQSTPDDQVDETLQERFQLPDIESGRIGMRVILRRRRIKIRRPSSKK